MNGERIARNLTDLIGNTPILEVQKFGKEEQVGARLLAKLESFNPMSSVKDRIAFNMIRQAEVSGELKPGALLIEPTSGNTGIGLAFVAAARGYRLILTMPDTMSVERQKLLLALGAELVLTPGAQGMKGAIARAGELVAENPGSVMLQQFENPANPAIHQITTAEEIWKDTEGKVDVVVAGVGTGGTITGISRAIKLDHGKKITSVAVEPTESPVISQTLAGQEVKPGPHKIQGIGAGFIPKNLDLSLIDRVETVDSDTAIATARRLMAEAGILAGISSGAAVAAADRLAKLPEFQDKLIVAILPSASERYLSTALFEGIEA